MHSTRYKRSALAVCAAGFGVVLLAMAGCPAADPPPPPCTPVCDGRVCGDDGCGGTCGSCEADQTCTPQGFCIGGEVCGGITLTGCCTGDGATVKWCDNGDIASLECDPGTLCGYRAEATVYACGYVPSASPDLEHPYLCPGESCPADTCAGQECGTDCGQSCGECASGQFCDQGACVACSCDDLQCGTDECGNVCGTCPEGEQCNTSVGQCQPDLCDGISFEGCCTGDGKLRYCDGGLLLTFGCGKQGTCGWRDDAFGFDCTVDGAPAPAGTEFLCPGETCANATPCSGRQCGFECGVACGTCETNQYCDDTTGTCEACSCDGKNCGDDGCGTSCGECPSGDVCDKDTQVCRANECGQVTGAGCCNADESAIDCVNGKLTSVNCAEFGLTCGWNGINYGCAPYQAAVPDEGIAYLCPAETCAKQCNDVQCGFACGEFCGGCPEGQWCDGSACQPCSCAGVECGSDGCGNACGVCEPDEVCDDFKGTCNKDGCWFTDFVGCCDGLTQHTCGWSGASAVVCANSCGWDAQEGAYRCGGDGDDPSGTHPKACQAP